MRDASLLILAICLIPLGYLYFLALASVLGARRKSTVKRERSATRFVVAIPAHDEENVIAATVQRLRKLDYPPELFSVHIVADHCSDETARRASESGAIVHERREGARTGKGAALSWLLPRVLNGDCDAVVVFDADTRVDSQFLRIMEARLDEGQRVIQGQHVISNPDEGWFPALTWAMFMIDNRFQNLGRSNVGWSAKHMGDSICFRAPILEEIGWGQGLTEDYQLRQKLLLAGYRITYEPTAIGYGEAPRSWSQARLQRARWLRGTHDASRQLGLLLLAEGVRRRDSALIDGALQAYLPSFSTLASFGLLALLIQVSANWIVKPMFPSGLILGWLAFLAALTVYPLLGLLLERAPLRAYLAISLGPFFVLWRTGLALIARRGGKNVTWVRTEHGG